MLGMIEPTLRFAHFVREIEFFDRQIRRLNATSALRHGHINPKLMGSAPVITTLFQDVLVRDAFIAVARLPSKAA
jgi:hypothetical protein